MTISVSPTPTSTDEEATSGARRRLPRVVSVLAVGTFLMLTTEFVVGALLPEVSVDLGVSLARAGLLITVFALGMVCAPVMTLLTLRLAHRTTLLLALLVFVVGHLVVATVSTFGVLLAARFVTALATGAFWAVSTVVAREATEPDSRSRAVGVISAGGMMATVLGVPLGAVVAEAVGWQGTFWALAAAAAVVSFAVSRAVPVSQVVGRNASAHEEPGVSVSTELKGLADNRLWLVLAGCFFTSGGVVTAYSYVAPFLTGRTRVSAAHVPIVLAVFGVAALIGTVVGGNVGDRQPHAVIVVVPLITALTLVALLALGGLVGPVIALLALLGLFGLSANPVLISMAVQFAGRAPTLGSGLGVAAFNAGTAAGTALAGLTISSRLGVSGPVATASLLSLVTLVPVVALTRLQQRGADPAGPRLGTEQ